MNFQSLKIVSQIGIYIGISLSSVLSWMNFQFKTAHDPESGHRKTVTPVGRLYGKVLVASFAITLTSAITQNIADSHLRQQAEERGRQQELS